MNIKQKIISRRQGIQVYVNFNKEKDNKSEDSNKFDIFKYIGMLGGVAAILYALGFVVDSTRLLNYGIFVLDIAQARYISVGLMFLLLVSMTSGSVAIITYTISHIVLPRIKKIFQVEKSEPRNKSPNYTLIAVGILSIVLVVLVYTVLIPFYIIHFISDFKTYSEFSSELQNTHALIELFHSFTKNRYYEWYESLMSLGMLIGIHAMLFKYGERDFNIFGRKVPDNDVYAKDNSSLRKFIPVRIFMSVLIAPLSIFILVGAIQFYSIRIYPYINASYGGGKYGLVQFIAKDTHLKRLLINQMETSEITKKLEYLGESTNSYIVLIHSKPQEAVLISKSLVIGLVGTKSNISVKPDGS